MIKEDEYVLRCKNWPHSIGYSDKHPDNHTYYFYNQDGSFYLVQIPKFYYREAVKND